jgi:hypothetical protein
MYAMKRTMPELYEVLASVIARLRVAQLEASRENPQLEPQLIVTTSRDVMLERAFLRAGIPFTRIVQHCSSPEITINQYADVSVVNRFITVASRDGQRSSPVETGDFEALDRVIASCGRVSYPGAKRADAEKALRQLPLFKYSAPYLYKYHGSCDIPTSSALSTDHYMRLAARDAIPERILEIIGNTAAAFVGSGLLDSDAIHAYSTLIRRATELKKQPQYPRIAVVNRPVKTSTDAYLLLESTVWPRVKDAVRRDRNIAMVEGEGEELLREMLTRL